MTKAKQKEQQEAIERLREWVRDGDTVYLVLRRVSASGMSRVIAPIVFRPSPYDQKPDPLFIGFNAALATGYSFDRKLEGVRLNGCGMDMGFSLVNDLARTLGIKLTHRWL